MNKADLIERLEIIQLEIQVVRRIYGDYVILEESLQMLDQIFTELGEPVDIYDVDPDVCLTD